VRIVVESINLHSQKVKGSVLKNVNVGDIIIFVAWAEERNLFSK
jgi:hypothetical protein